MKIGKITKEITRINKKISKIKKVDAIYVFGSYVDERFNPYLSDIDICIIGNLNQEEKYKILREIPEIFDISFFDELPIYIKFRVLKQGKCLFMRDLEKLNTIKLITISEYLDFKSSLNKFIEKF